MQSYAYTLTLTHMQVMLSSTLMLSSFKGIEVRRENAMRNIEDCSKQVQRLPLRVYPCVRMCMCECKCKCVHIKVLPTLFLG